MKRSLGSLPLSIVASALLVGVAALVGCGDEEEGETGPKPTGFGGPAPVVVPDLSGPLLRIDPAELAVKRALTLVISRTDRAGDRNPFTGEVADARRDALYRLNYETGAMQLVREEPTEGRLSFPLFMVSGDDRPYYLTLANTFDSATLHAVDLAPGGGVSETQLQPTPELCEVVTGGDFFYVAEGQIQVARDFTAETGPVTAQPFAERSACALDLFALDGWLVRLDRITEPGGEVFVLQALDPTTAQLQSAPLAQIPVSELTDDVRFAVAEDGLYALTRDQVSIELWRAAYARRPGDPVPADPISPPAAERLARVEPVFFAELIFGSGLISIDSVFAFSVRDGVAAFGALVLEDAPDGRFIYAGLVMTELATEAVDLISLGGSFNGLDLFPTP